jgi:DNA replication and repair protein RecF
MDAQLVRHGADRSRVAITGHRGHSPLTVDVTLSRREAKHADVNGGRLRSIEHLRREITTLVFTPDRLALVKGAPAVRRAYLDRSLARLLPGRADLPVAYLTAVGQRNAALRRVAAGMAERTAIDPWTNQVVAHGAALVEARTLAVEMLSSGFAATAGELGLDAGLLEYVGAPPTH